MSKIPNGSSKVKRGKDMALDSLSNYQAIDLELNEVYRTSIEETSAESMSTAVVEAIAEITGKSVTEIGPMQDVFHSEALDNLLGLGEGNQDVGQFPGLASFEFEGFFVTVHGTGKVVIYS